MFIWPLMFMNHGNGVSLVQGVMMGIVQLAIMVVFYANYWWLVPKHFVTGDKRFYCVVNAAIITLFGIGWHYSMEMLRQNAPDAVAPPPPFWMSIVFTLRDMFNLACSAAIATLVHLALRWQQSEVARRQAELKNLRSQINPHFLLNTLNNIYALTAFKPQRAQEAIQELSKLLRHILYDYDEPFTSLEEEVRFIENYINLMKIRLTDNVEVTFKTDIPSPCNYRIAPMIIISLVENAFKHGVSPRLPSFIHINIAADDKKITCHIENSYFPKNGTDRSGHGVGLQQVASRLELLYPGKYTWEKCANEDKTIYKSIITINDTKLRNN